eukprot:MONOS_9437.1-p1 / transcript=MONOS_9437.1 / gene=MONOS_9437 / organism=Monocercomonoides_exilis_PA203 / gene_product=unspecified product / transcript_product=unspecified product / location=Mono_scaffold00390:17814-20036(+) / protein_length=741 / sequence_SO=supercontig / SO=protein_coding / is_pseudo=false
MSQLLQSENEIRQRRSINISSKEGYSIIRRYNDQFNSYGSNKHLTIILGKCSTGKSTMIDALLGTELRETWDGKIVKVNESSEGPKIGNGRIAETQLPKVYKLDERVCLLDTRGFHGTNIDDETDILNTLILEANLRKCSKVSVLYLSEFSNYCNLSRLEEDMLLVNDICEDMNLPVLFVANKCKEPLKYELKASKESEEIQIKQIEKFLHEQFMEMYKGQMDEIKNKYFKQINLSDSNALSDEKIIGILIEKANDSTGLEKSNLVKCLSQVKILYMLKKALEEGRFIFNDPVNSYSVDRLRGILHDEQYYVYSNRLSLGRCTPKSFMFLNWTSEMAIKLSWLVEAMIGRIQFPKNYELIIEACEYFIRMLEQDSCKLSSDETKLFDELRKLDVESPELVDSRIQNEENSISNNQEMINFSEKLIASLDTDEPVLYEKYHFAKKNGFFSNEIVIEKPVNIPNSTFEFIPANKHTKPDDERLKPGIESGWLRGAFKAESKIHKIASNGLSFATKLIHSKKVKKFAGAVVFGLTSPLLKLLVPNKTCVCEGAIEFSAPSRDLPTNAQKIGKLKARVADMGEQIEKAGNSIAFLQETKEKIKMAKSKLEETKMMKEVWQKREEKVEEILRFCDECDKKYEENREKINQLYLFARRYLPQTFVNQLKAEKLMASTSSSLSPSSSAVPSMSSPFEGTQQKSSSSSAESSFLPSVCECKAIENEKEEEKKRRGRGGGRRGGGRGRR